MQILYVTIGCFINFTKVSKVKVNNILYKSTSIELIGVLFQGR